MENYHYEVESTEAGSAVTFHPVTPEQTVRAVPERLPVGPCGLVEGPAYWSLQQPSDIGQLAVSFLREVQ